MKYKIGVFGSAEEEKKALRKAKELGRELSKHNPIVITGACGGIPYKVASTAYSFEAEIWGFAPVVIIDSDPKKLVVKLINQLA
jgi:predicted Rossmann-fold nucleotide-binding protein